VFTSDAFGAGATSTATNFAASASRNLFFHAKNCPFLRPRTLQNAATLCPLWFCSATSPRHFAGELRFESLPGDDPALPPGYLQGSRDSRLAKPNL